jgi:hypothetical protein
MQSAASRSREPIKVAVKRSIRLKAVPSSQTKSNGVSRTPARIHDHQKLIVVLAVNRKEVSVVTVRFSYWRPWRVDFLHFALDSDQRALASLTAARPIFGPPIALFGAWLSFRQRG